MAEDQPPCPEVDAELIRRRHARLRLGIPARFEALSGRYQVRLVNLSEGGAHIVLPDPMPVREGVLAWIKFQTFGMAIWQEGADVGLAFDRPLSRSCLRATRDYAPDLFNDLVRGFVDGTDGSLR